MRRPTDPAGQTPAPLPTTWRTTAVLAALAALVTLLVGPGRAGAAPVRATAATVTVEQASGQPDPANAGPIVFTVVFSEPVTGFDAADVSLSGSAGATTAAVTGTGASYTINVTGMTSAGTVIASIPANRVTGGNAASTSADNTVTYDAARPTVTVNQGPAQGDPAAAGPIVFRAVFSESVTGFADGDVTLGGTANPTTANVTGSGTTYTISVTGMTGNGTVTASIGANRVTDLAGNQNEASTSTDNTVTYRAPVDETKPSVTVEQGPAQADPTSTSPIVFRAVFSETVTGFANGDVTLGGTAGATTATVTGGGTTYTISVTGMTGSGTVTASIGAGRVTDGAGNGNTASTSTDNTVTYTFTTTRPSVKVDQASGQADPTSTSPVSFTVVFSEPVSGFAPGDVTLGGTAGATTATISGGPTTYKVDVSGMTRSGTVVLSVAANVVSDASGDQNLASTSTDNTVTYQAPVATTIAYTGDRSVKGGTTLRVRALLRTTPTTASCLRGRTVTFHLDRNPGPLGAAAAVPGVDGTWVPLALARTSGGGGASTAVSTGGWAAGSYKVLAVAAASGACPAASATETLTVVRRGLVAAGDGWIRTPWVTDFRFSVTRVGDGPSDVRGSIVAWSGRRWKVVATPTGATTRPCDGVTCAEITGTGRLYESVQVSGRRTRRTSDDRYRWIVRADGAQLTLTLVDRGSRRGVSDRFGIRFTAPAGLEGLRGTTGTDTVALRRGFVEIRG